jgi:hypothetical protein
VEALLGGLWAGGALKYIGMYGGEMVEKRESVAALCMNRGVVCGRRISGLQYT